MRSDSRQIAIIELSIKIALAVLTVYAVVLATGLNSLAMVSGLIVVEAMAIGMREAIEASEANRNRNKLGLFGFIVLLIRATMTGFCNCIGWAVDLAKLIIG